MSQKVIPQPEETVEQETANDNLEVEKASDETEAKSATAFGLPKDFKAPKIPPFVSIYDILYIINDL